MLKQTPPNRVTVGSTHRDKTVRVLLAALQGVFLYTRAYTCTRLQRLRVSGVVAIVAAIAVGVLSYGIFFQPATATAGPANTINFQARLETAAGSIAADGFYNVRFKLYSASSGGTALWTETYAVSATQGIRTANGYLTANLGGITAFPSNIDWGQQLYLTMEIGGTGTSPSWDGEMSPRLSLTSVPSAFALNSYNSALGYTGSLKVAQPTGGSQTFTVPDQGAAGNYTLLTTNTANSGFIQNQIAGAQATSNFWISGTGRAATSLQAPAFDTPAPGTLSIGVTSATAITIGKAGVTTTVAGPLNSTGLITANGGLTVASGSLFTNGSATLFIPVNRTIASGSIGTAAQTVDIATSINVTVTTAGQTVTVPSPTNTAAGRLVYITNVGANTFSVAGTTLATHSTTTLLWDGSAWTSASVFGSTNAYIDNGTSVQAFASFNIDGSGRVGSTFQSVGLLTASGGLTVTGATSVTGTTGINTTGSAATNIGNASSTTTLAGTTNINTAGSSGTNIGNSGSTTTISGPLNVNATSTFTGTHNVTGATNINTSGTATTNIGSATSATAIGGTLGVTGATTLSGTLGVTGAATLNSTLNVTGLSTLSSLAVTGTSTLTGQLTTNGGISNTGNYAQTGATTFSTGTGAISLNGAVTAASTLTVSGAATFNGDVTISANTELNIDGATLFTAFPIANHGSNGALTTAANIDGRTFFRVTQTTGGITMTIPNPTNTTSSHIIYVSSIPGNATFTLNTVQIVAGQTASFIWNGAAWVVAGTTGNGTNSIGTFDTFTTAPNGATISGTTLYLQSATGSVPGLVNTGTQTFAGTKTFTGQINASLASGTGLAVTANATIGGTLGVTSTVTIGGALTVSAGGASITGGINNNNGGITNTGAITGATGITSSGTITLSGLSTAGIVTNTAGGVLGTVNSIPVANGGTGLTSVTAGQILIGTSGGGLSAAVIGSGTNITVTSGSGSISVATVPNPSFATSVTTPTLIGTAGGALTVQSAVGQNLALNTGTAGGTITTNAGTIQRSTTGGATTTINLADSSTTVLNINNSGTGVSNLNLQDGGLTVASTSVLTNARLLQNLTGVTSSGTITFSALSTAGIVTNTGGGVLGTVASVPVANGGTGVTSFTANQLLLGNGTGAISQVASVGSTGQCLIANTSAAPNWGSCTTGAVTTLGTYSTTNTSAFGATLSGSTLTFQSASISAPGMVDVGTQTFAGNKTFNNSLTVVGGGSIQGNISIATTAGNTLSIGNATGALTVTGSASSNFVIGGVTVSAAEFNLLDGKNAALVDVNDAVTTAITGTGALTSGSIASGFGTINSGNTITGTSINGTTGINTGAGLGTQRITAAGLLTNITGITAAGTLNLNTTGGGATNIGTSATANAVTIGSANTTFSLDSTGFDVTTAGVVTAASTIQGTRLISTVATGTAPLTVASTTLVTNLNADMLDGLHASSFASASGSASYIQNQNASAQASSNFWISGNGRMDGSLTVGAGATINGNSLIATAAGNTLSLGNATGALTVTGSASSNFVIGGVTVSAAEFNLLDGKNAALVDVNDAVTTAITGTGALASGSIATGFGTINTGSTITGTTVNGTTGINTGATAGTLRIDASGNLVNIGTIAASGAVTAGTYNGQILNATASFTGTLTVATSVSSPRLISTVATGTAPLTVTSTTLVTNLNADMLDGFHASSFATSTGGAGYIQNQNAAAQTTANFWISGNGQINGSLTVSGGASIQGNTTIATTAGNTLSIGNATGALTVTGSASSNFILGGVTVSAAEFNLLDGKNAALVDVNDAVSTAIVGTGALNSGSITSGFGTINNADNITGTTINATTGISTGGTSRLSSTGVLSSITGITAAGTLNLNTTGTGVTNIGTTASANAINIGSANTTLSIASTGFSATTAGVVTAASTIQGTRLISTVATGTAPLTVASTTLVTNLNADMLDGQHGSYYATATGGTGYIQNQNAAAQTTANFWISGNGRMDGTLTVGGAAQFNGSLTIGAGDALTIGGSTTFGTVAVGNNAANGAIGTAAATVDISSAFIKTQTTTNRVLTIPNPTVTTGNRVIYITSAAGNVNFTINSVVISAGQTATFIWNGSTWNLTMTSGIGTNTIGTFDTFTNDSDGGTISGSTLYLQSASTSAPGLVNTTSQSFLGAKTFTSALNATLASGTGLAVTANATVGGTLVVTGAITGGSLNTSGGASIQGNTTIATTAGNTLSIGNATGALTVTGSASSNFILGGVTISQAEFILLDGKNAPLVDTNDAVATAITGTGALNAGTISTGFGVINTGDNISGTNITGTTINATTGINTGGTNRITSAGALVNITTMTASGMVQGSQITSTIATGNAPLVVASTTRVDNLNVQYLNGYAENQIAQNLRSNDNITGGGTVSFDGTNVRWTARFIVIANGNGSDFSTAGYYDINQPTSGTVTGVGGAPNVTATASGIPLAAWTALYYILPIGGSSTSNPANFRVATYTSALQVPSNWVLIAVRNGDNGIVKFTAGYNLASGQSSTGSMSSQYIQNQNTAAQSANFWIGGNGTLNGSLTVVGGASIQGNTTIATTAGNTLSMGNATGALTVTGSAASNFVIGGVTVSAAEFNLLDGKTGTILDNNDAIATAITGTGALNAGSISTGFGVINTGDNISGTNITGTTINATTGISTGGTSRITNTGNLVSIGSITAAGTLNLNTTGGAVTNIGTTATANAINIGSANTTLGITSTGFSATTAGVVTAASTIQGTRLISTVATGTAPLTVASTTLVTNLNADMLDGQHGSYYATATGGTGYIQNQNASAQTTANFWISGNGQINGSLTVSGGASIQGNTTIATTAGNTLSMGNATGALTVTGSAASNFVIGGVTVSAAEFNLLDGKTGTILDNNDAIATAITGTGALNAGSISTGFGVINTGDNISGTNITGTTINATTGINTGGTNRITSAGALTNITTISASGAVTAGTYNSQTISSAANFTGTLTVQGAGGITTGVASSATGQLRMANSGSANLLTLTTAAMSNGAATITIPAVGASYLASEQLCLRYTNNCGGPAGAMGALDGGTANATGGTIAGNFLYLQSASTSAPGLVNTTSQSFLGAKTFTSALNATLASGTGLAVTANATVGGTLVVTGAITGGSLNTSGGASIQGNTTIATTAGNTLTLGNTTGLLTVSGNASSTFTFGSTVVNASELILLDGKNAALVDVNDAVSTAIVGTGALNSGSITSGFGTINNAATITGTSINGTTGINTGAGLGTNRITAAGALVNIGAITATGVMNIQNSATIRGLTVNTATVTQDQILITAAAVGAARFNGTITNTDLTAAQTWTLPNASGTFITTGNLSGITATGTIASGVWQGTAITDAYISDTLTIGAAGNVDWDALSGYPAACAAGSAISTLNDTPTCTAFATGTAGSYIQNGVSVQSGANFNIAGNGVIGGTLSVTGAVTGGTYNGQTIANTANFTGTLTAASNLSTGGKLITSRLGSAGTYNSAQVQGIWTIGDPYPIDTTANNFGVQYGIVYAHTNAGTSSNKLPIAGWGHQILFTSNGVRNAAISLDTGNGYFAGAVGAASFSGDGSALTALNATQLTTGTVPTGRLNGPYTGITGTGALNSGSITSGFGTINNAATITGTTLNGTTGINTGAGVGTNRINSAGALVNITGITAAGTLNLNTTGGAVTNIGTTATANAINIGSANTTLGITSTGFSATTAGVVTAASTIQGTRLISTVATGTAPLTVASTTLVTNLNADMLDGQHGSYYATATGGTGYIQNQNASAQTTANFWISGNGRMNGTLTVGGAATFAGNLTTSTALFTSGFLQFGGSALTGFYGDSTNIALRGNNVTNSALYVQSYSGATTTMFAGLTGTYAGRLGVNTTTPSYTLDVQGDINTNGALRINGAAICNAGGCMTNGSNAYLQNGNSFGGTALIGTNDNNAMHFKTNNTTKMVINAAGNVGIGLTNPGSMLDVNGPGSSSYTASYVNGYYYCPNGGTLSGSSCSYGASYVNGYYYCPNGGTLSGTSCSYAAVMGCTSGTYAPAYNNCVYFLGSWGDQASCTYVYGGGAYYWPANALWSGSPQGCYSAAGSPSYTCPNGGSLSGTTCTYSAAYSNGYYHCPSGGSLSGSTCTYGATYVNGYYYCPNGGTLSGTTCTSGADIFVIRAASTKILSVNSSGQLRASGSITANTTPDIAEFIPAAPDVETADVVMADPNNTERVVKATHASRTKAVGVISDGSSSFMINPYGQADGTLSRTDIKPLVLAGRVPVKISGENGAVIPGDHLTVSATMPGYAMKATEPGATIGKSLGFFEGTTGTVLVLVNNSYHDPAGTDRILQGSGLQVAGDATIGGSLNVGGLATIGTLSVTGDALIAGNLVVEGTLQVSGIVVGGHVITAGDTPLVVIGEALGQAVLNQVNSAPQALVDGTDTTGTVSVTAGADQLASGVLAEINFAMPFVEGTTYKAVLTPTNEQATNLRVYIVKTATGFNIVTRDAPVAGTQYQFDYIVMGAKVAQTP